MVEEEENEDTVWNTETASDFVYKTNSAVIWRTTEVPGADSASLGDEIELF